MPITDRHRAAESRFRRLVTDAGLPGPDSVEYAPDSVTFLWHESKAAIVVDLDDAAPLDDVEAGMLPTGLPPL